MEDRGFIFFFQLGLGRIETKRIRNFGIILEPVSRDPIRSSECLFKRKGFFIYDDGANDPTNATHSQYYMELQEFEPITFTLL